MVDWEVLNARFRKRQAAQRPPAFRHEVAFKVPAYLKEVKPSQYRPHTVSLGLNMRLEPGIEDYKAEFQRCFVRWNNHSLETSTPQSARSPKSPRSPSGQRYGRNLLAIDYVDYTSAYKWDQFISDLKLDTDVKTANRWYEIDSSPVQPDILKSFLALDALFLTLFLRYSCNKIPVLRLPNEVFAELAEPVFRLLAEAPASIWRDVFLLENQIPLHILAKVWVLMPDMKPGVGGRTSNEALRLFNKLLKEVVKDRYLKLFESSSEEGKSFVSKALSDKNFVECDHLLHCFHYATCYSPSPPDGDKSVRIFTANESGTSPANTIPSAIQLRKVGISLNSDGCNFISQIKFENFFWRGPVLTVPRLFISDETDSLLRNLAVFEMVSGYQFLCPSLGPRLSTVTSFLVLLDKLIQQKSDVKLMRVDGIITSSMGNNAEVCEMWATLCKRFSSYQHPEWVEMLKKLTVRYRNRPHQLLAEFKDKYFARPWVVVGWVGAIMLLILTGLQTFYTVIPYYWPQSCPS